MLVHLTFRGPIPGHVRHLRGWRAAHEFFEGVLMRPIQDVTKILLKPAQCFRTGGRICIRPRLARRGDHPVQRKERRIMVIGRCGWHQQKLGHEVLSVTQQLGVRRSRCRLTSGEKLVLYEEKIEIRQPAFRVLLGSRGRNQGRRSSDAPPCCGLGGGQWLPLNSPRQMVLPLCLRRRTSICGDMNPSDVSYVALGGRRLTLHTRLCAQTAPIAHHAQGWSVSA